MKKKQTMEDVVHGVFLLLGLVTVGCVLLITVYLILSGLPAITKIGLGNFLFGTEWSSTASDPKYGILPFILTSVYGTCGAILLGVPVGFLTAVFLSKMAPKKLRSIMESAVSLLAGIPSVVYGLVGMLVLVPGIRKLFYVPDGASLLAAMVVLAIMILPSIIKVSVNALDAVPKEYENASLALGATPVETWFRVSAPAARSGIAAAVVLGVGRAIGEAMAVMMVSGNAPNMPSLFESVRFLTTAVASEMSYASGLQRQPLRVVPPVVSRRRGAIVGRLQAHKLPALRVDDNAEELTGLLPALADKIQLRLKARQDLCGLLGAGGGKRQQHHAGADADQQQDQHHLQEGETALRHYFFPRVQLPISSLVSGIPSGPTLKTSMAPC